MEELKSSNVAEIIVETVTFTQFVGTEFDLPARQFTESCLVLK
jgi:hypothetical protein